MKKIISLALCAACAVTFSGYEWDTTKSDKKKSTTSQAQTQVTWQTAPTKPVLQKASPVVSQTTVQPGSVKAPTPPSEVPASASDKAQAISTLAKIVGSGTPEERQARIESLKRLSQAMAQNQAQNQPAPPPAPKKAEKKFW